MNNRSKISEIYFHLGLLSLYVVIFISPGCSNIQPENGSGDSDWESLSGIRYTINPPDGGDFFWKLLKHKDDYWEKATSFDDLSGLINKSKPAIIWIRVIYKHTPASLNNVYFSFSGSGDLELAVNGIASGFFHQTDHKYINVPVPPRRPEVLGENIYTFYFENTEADFHFDLEMMDQEWICTDKCDVEASPVMNAMIRDAMICKGGDSNY